MKQENWHSLSINDVLHNLKSSKTGLSSEEAKKRIKKYGKNELSKKEKFTELGIAINQFKGPLVYILLVAALISFVLKEFIDMGVILFAVIINAVVGFIQETKSEHTLEKLKKMVDYRSYVIRNGIEKEIDSANIVPGDIVILKAGDRVPVDGRILEIHELDIDESSLTGESFPISKTIEISDQKGISESKENMAYMGTSVVRGRGIIIASATGVDTKFGQIAFLLEKTEEEKTPLQVQLTKFSKSFGILVFIMVLLIMIIGLWRGIEFFKIFTTAVAIAVAAIPEGLLVAVTIVLAIGMQRILKKGSLVRKLIAAETLGNTSVICTDKTGTLTEGNMQVDHIITIYSEFSLSKEKNKHRKLIEKEKYKLDHIVAMKIGMICNNAIIENPDDELEDWIIHGDYTEKALLQSGINVGFSPEKIKKDFVKIEEIPFGSERKFMATLNKENKGDYKIYVKGAPEKIINRSKYVLVNGNERKMTEYDLRFLKKKQDDLSKKGLRVIGVAYKNSNKDIAEKFIEENDDEVINKLIFVGLIALKDPLRKEAKDTIKLAKEAGIKTIIITGDNYLTARTIANEIGMKVDDNNILNGEKLDCLSTKEFDNIVNKIKIYARVSPRHKSRIVDAWQNRGEVVAMTGDGVNDAPALKSADIGIALGSGTEVAKETADIVLLDNNFKTIITAVEQGRIIFDNIRKVTLYLLSDSFSEVIIVGGSLLLGISLPLTVAQILWINIITDSFPNAALTVEPEEREVMKEPPRKKNEPLLNFEMKTLIILISIITGLITLGLFIYVNSITGDLEKARTISFTILAIDSLFYVFSIRSIRHSIFHKNIFSNKYLVISVIIGFLFQIFVIYNSFMQTIFETVSLNIADWSLIIFTVGFVIFLIEIIKYLFLIKNNK